MTGASNIPPPASDERSVLNPPMRLTNAELDWAHSELDSIPLVCARAYATPDLSKIARQDPRSSD